MIIIIIIISLVLLFIILFFINFVDKIKLAILRKKYNPDDDQSRRGEERRLRSRGLGNSKQNVIGQIESPRSGVLQTTGTGFAGETSSSTGESSDAVKNFFKKLRKK